MEQAKARGEPSVVLVEPSQSCISWAKKKSHDDYRLLWIQLNAFKTFSIARKSMLQFKQNYSCFFFNSPTYLFIFELINFLLLRSSTLKGFKVIHTVHKNKAVCKWEIVLQLHALPAGLGCRTGAAAWRPRSASTDAMYIVSSVSQSPSPGREASHSLKPFLHLLPHCLCFSAA